jgi:hypothetical protein
MIKKISKLPKSKQWYIVLLILILLGFTFLGLVLYRPLVVKEKFYNQPVKWNVVLVTQKNNSSEKFVPLFDTATQEWSDNVDNKMFNYRKFDLKDLKTNSYGVQQGPVIIVLKQISEQYNIDDRVKRSSGDLAYTPKIDHMRTLIDSNNLSLIDSTSATINTEIKAFLNEARSIYISAQTAPTTTNTTARKVNNVYKFTNTPKIAGNVDTTSLVWWTAYGNRSYWTGQGKPNWLCESLPYNQSEKKSYEYIYNNTIPDMTCIFYWQCDNIGKLYLNDEFIGTSNTWAETKVDYGVMQVGSNRILIECTNTGGPGGIICSCTRRIGQNEELLFITDSSWRMN